MAFATASGTSRVTELCFENDGAADSKTPAEGQYIALGRSCNSRSDSDDLPARKGMIASQISSEHLLTKRNIAKP